MSAVACIRRTEILNCRVDFDDKAEVKNSVSQDNLNMSRVLTLAERSFIDLGNSYRESMRNTDDLLYRLFNLACSASLRSTHGIDVPAEKLKEFMVVASSSEQLVSREHILRGMEVAYGSNDCYIVLRTADESEFRSDQYSIWIACTALGKIRIGDHNIATLVKYLTVQNHVDGNGRILKWPRKADAKLKLLNYILSAIDFPIECEESQINTLLSYHTDDVALVRRELIVSGLLSRTTDGSRYWVT